MNCPKSIDESTPSYILCHRVRGRGLFRFLLYRVCPQSNWIIAGSSRSTSHGFGTGARWVRFSVPVIATEGVIVMVKTMTDVDRVGVYAETDLSRCLAYRKSLLTYWNVFSRASHLSHLEGTTYLVYNLSYHEHTLNHQKWLEEKTRWHLLSKFKSRWMFSSYSERKEQLSDIRYHSILTSPLKIGISIAWNRQS